MMLSQASKLLTRQVVYKAENVLSIGMAGRVQNNSQAQTLLLIPKRCKKTGTEKRCEENPKKSKKLVTIATAAVIGTSVAIVTAKYDDDFRQWSKEHCPILDSLVKIIFQEEETYLESLDRGHKKLSDWIKHILYDLIKGDKRGKDSKGVKSGGSSEACEEAKKPYKPPESAFLIKSDEEKKDQKVEGSGRSEKVPRDIKDLKDLEDKLGHVAQDTIQAFAAAVCAIREKANLIDYLDQLISSNDPRVWEKLKKKTEDTSKNLQKAETGFLQVEAIERKLNSQLKEKTNLDNDVKAKATNNLTIVTNDVKKAKENADKEKEKAVLARRSWDKVKQARMFFSDELETLFPNVWLNDEKLNIPPENFEPFVENVLNNLRFLDKELAKLQSVTEAEVNSAVEKYKTGSDPEVNDAVVEAAVKVQEGKEKRRLQTEAQKNLLTHKAKCEKNAKQLMKQQAEVYSDLTVEALKMKEREVERKMQQQLEERLANVRAQHKMEIAKMVGRIQGANEAIAQRGDKDKEQQEKQQFWSAAQSFMSAISPIGVANKPKEPKPLKNEITNITKVAPEGDELVDSVVSSIPKQAVDRGVQSESTLQERFIKVEKEARKWAGVPQGEISLLQLFLARLQSALYLNLEIPEAELNNEPAIDPEQLNNYDILYRAKYYVDRGEFPQAIKYLNLLKGPSEKVASDWIKDALVYLETKQAAEVLLAHASANSMQA